ncbi:exodeoxyribonuclease III [Rhizophagus irregularis DAOM 181602=DAOM 197198]|uniref:Endonuclease/exonuclease/phosphatase domain-containing protein n=1 Tax=Rhizophagus irregularis (strain DAOM 181602 / DAOM 197198 / MUCL 43194) TaxID=747089 RepID=A0A2H5RLC6_RHIID|nr:hypothetical protein GLOIN_2v1762286 [Rhizophagus irregularis DAOM 181602=DAOM 197198]POG82094.1 hypothetical protein GLOIN_2v1762286 [Rhizophagus irregularis DAOM 181602=DAOM 197198]GET57582.1 exodeoxyribonuclease III [Rhizophagus irregularis DAOM 181602=DAOM 197198]|eukprot:XP_025188960.1 hypothetical protein GLOIN_2v1762286 [Rhizophagus irregularis DAOM 181602=DAOM 197198]
MTDATPARKQITKRQIVISTTQEIMMKEMREGTIGMTTHNPIEADTTTKEIFFDNRKETIIDKEIITSEDIMEMDIMETEEDTTQDLIKELTKMSLEEEEIDTITPNNTTNTINKIDTTTTMTTTTTTTTEETTITTTTEMEIEEAMDTTIDINRETNMKEEQEQDDTNISDNINQRESNKALEEPGKGKITQSAKKENGKNSKNKKGKKWENEQKIKNNNIKIGCINVRGMNDIKKQGEIRNFLGKEKWDIAIISETKLKESKGKHIYSDWKDYECINSSYNNENTKNGLIILLRKEINDRRYAIEKIDGHVIKLDILFRGNQKNIRIIGIYNPNDDKPTTTLIETKIAKWMNEAINLEYEMIILGDFNESANDKKKKKKRPLTATIKQHGLQDVHECLTAEKDMLDTWRSGEYSSRIDFIFLSEGVEIPQFPLSSIYKVATSNGHSHGQTNE